MQVRRRGVFSVILAGSLAAMPLYAQVAAPKEPRESATTIAALNDWSRNVWDTARAGKSTSIAEVLERLGPVEHDAPASLSALRASVDRLKSNVEKREQQREARRAELIAELDEALQGEMSDSKISDGLRSAIELQMISPDREKALANEHVTKLIAKADSAARSAETRGDWLVASELYYRLHALLEEKGMYEKDTERLGQRLALLRLYVPERLWEMRNQRLIAENEDPLPPYNGFGNDFQEHLAGVDESMVRRAVRRTVEHVDSVAMSKILAGALESCRTFVTTTDLAAKFEGLKDADQVKAMTAFLDTEIAAIKANNDPDLATFDAIFSRLRKQNEATVRIPWNALLHEFGNGAIAQLDPFSAIIWPDELRRFQRTTQGKVVGVGVQIEYDQDLSVKVATPIAGSPADEAGIRAGDIIKKVDGRDTYGMSLDQAVDLITGQPGTRVALTIEREDEGKKGEIEVAITRKMIDITTVRGWKRTGKGESDWDWYLDRDGGVGYVRISQFTDTTTKEFDAAIRKLRETGTLRGLVLDLRYNPGGLLDQAVSIVQRFVDVEGGKVVGMSGQNGIEDPEKFMTNPRRATLADLPIVVLVNENSASASEIVSGALRHYGHQGGEGGQPAIHALVLGARSYGKGSVQTVSQISANAMMKLTVQYYTLPDGKIIHRRPGSKTWGVEPDVSVEMLPRQQDIAMTIRRNADITKPGDPPRPAPKPKVKPGKKAPPEEPTSTDPQDTLAQGTDLQLETALVLLKSQTVPQQVAATGQ